MRIIFIFSRLCYWAFAIAWAALCSSFSIFPKNKLPLIKSVPANIIVYSKKGECGTSVIWQLPVARNCVISSDYAPGHFFPTGITKVHYFFKHNGGTIAYSFNVTVVDKTAPTIISKNLTLECIDGQQKYLTPDDVDDGSYDDCGITEKWLSESNFSNKTSGTYTTNLFAKDRSGNVSSAEVFIEVRSYPRVSLSIPTSTRFAKPASICP